jgi:hypothetical protein
MDKQKHMDKQLCESQKAAEILQSIKIFMLASLEYYIAMYMYFMIRTTFI